jgi:hypothetical protein
MTVLRHTSLPTIDYDNIFDALLTIEAINISERLLDTDLSVTVVGTIFN